MANRSAPYPSVSRPTRLELGCGWYAWQQDQNKDAVLLGSRFIGLFGAVESVIGEGFIPGAMPADLAARISDELDERLEINAQQYDQKTQVYLKSTVRPNMPGGSIRNLIAKCFVLTEARGSAVLGLCHVTGDKLDYCILGNITLYLVRRTSESKSSVRLVECILVVPQCLELVNAMKSVFNSKPLWSTSFELQMSCVVPSVIT